jgi:enamine deaminase RidA (YjgF/YER057c/UK114 family)
MFIHRTLRGPCQEEAAAAHGEFFSAIRPACTFVEVKGLINPEWLVELEADCVAETGS